MFTFYFQDKGIEVLRIKADASASALFSNATPLTDQYLEQGYTIIKLGNGTKIRFPPLTTGEIEIEKALKEEQVRDNPSGVVFDGAYVWGDNNSVWGGTVIGVPTTTGAATQFVPLSEIKELSPDQIDEWQRTGTIKGNNRAMIEKQVEIYLEEEKVKQRGNFLLSQYYIA